MARRPPVPPPEPRTPNHVLSEPAASFDRLRTNGRRVEGPEPRSVVPARERLIVALDVPALDAAARLVNLLAPAVTWFKIGSELFTAAGPQAVTMVRDRGGRVFLDLKYHDIPNTVGRAVAAAARLGVSMLNIHVAAGKEALRAAVEIIRIAVPEPRTPNHVLSEPAASFDRLRTNGRRVEGPEPRPLLLGVTLLTSRDDSAAVEHVVAAARLAHQCGLDGVVASARETAAIKRACGAGFACVTPGIRPSGFDPADQRRVATPREAAAAGADYLVVGRPVLTAADPRSTVQSILEEIDAATRQETGTPAGN